MAYRVDSRNCDLLRGGLAVVHRRADQESGIFPRVHPATQSRTLWQRSLSPQAAVLVLPAGEFAGADSMDGVRNRRIG